MVGKNRMGGRQWLTSQLTGTDRAALLALVLANVIPLLLIFALGWEPAGVLVFYWWENLVVGFYSLLRIGLAGGEGLQKSKLLLVPFFCFHYFFFCFVHGVFVMILSSVMAEGDMFGPSFMESGFLKTAWERLPTGGLFSIGLLMISHGVSLFQELSDGRRTRSDHSGD